MQEQISVQLVGIAVLVGALLGYICRYYYFEQINDMIIMIMMMMTTTTTTTLIATNAFAKIRNAC